MMRFQSKFVMTLLSGIIIKTAIKNFTKTNLKDPPNAHFIIKKIVTCVY